MSRTAAPALAISHGLLRVLLFLNGFFGLFLLGLLVTSIVAPQFFIEGMHIRGEGGVMTTAGMRTIMALGLASVPLAHVLLSRLLAIVGTVGSGDPFVARNAARLRQCAWAVLGMEVLHLLIGAVSWLMSTPDQKLELNWTFSPTGLLAVLLLFVLAQVFTQGARMRDDLEGTV